MHSTRNFYSLIRPLTDVGGGGEHMDEGGSGQGPSLTPVKGDSLHVLHRTTSSLLQGRKPVFPSTPLQCTLKGSLRHDVVLGHMAKPDQMRSLHY